MLYKFNFVNKKSILFKYRIVFLLFIIPTIILGMYANKRLIQQSKNEIKKIQNVNLDIVANFIDSQIFDLRTFSDYLSVSEDIINIQNRNSKIGYTDYTLNNRIQAIFKQEIEAKPYINNISVAMLGTQKIVDYKLGLTSIIYQSDEQLSNDKFINGNAFCLTMIDNLESIGESTEREFLILSNKYPLKGDSKNIMISITISPIKFFEYIINTVDTENFTVLVYNKDLDQIVIKDDKIEIDENFKNQIVMSTEKYLGEFSIENFTIMQKESIFDIWKYMSISNYKEFADMQNAKQKINYLALLLFFSIGVFISNSVSKSLYKPIIGMVNMFSRENKVKDNEYNYLKEEISSVILKNYEAQIANKKLEAQFQWGSLLIREQFALKLVSNEFTNYEEIIEYEKTLNLSWEKPLFGVISFSVFNNNRLESIKNTCGNNLIEDIYNKLNLTGDSLICIKENIASIILNINNIHEYVAFEAIIVKYIKANYQGLNYILAMGGTASSIFEVGSLFQTSVECIKQSYIGSINTTISYMDLSASSNIYCRYPKKTQKRLFRKIETNDLNDCINCVDLFIKNLIESNKNNYNSIIFGMQRLIMQTINHLLHQGIELKNILEYSDDVLNLVLKHVNIYHTGEWLKALIERAVKYRYSTADKQKDQLISQILKYIEEHYEEPISLNCLSDYFSLNSSYISSLIKEETGDNFIEILTKVRLEKAKILLLETNMKIKQIGTKVGYQYEQYFIKVFKRHFGITPKQFKVFNCSDGSNIFEHI